MIEHDPSPISGICMGCGERVSQSSGDACRTSAAEPEDAAFALRRFMELLDRAPHVRRK